MKKFAFFIVLFMCSLFVSGANVEKDTTLIRISKIKSQTKQIDQLNDAVESCWLSGQYLRGLNLIDYTIRHARTYKYKSGEAKALINKGIIFDYLAKYSEAISLYLDGLKIYESTHDDLGICETYNNLGLAYENQSKNDQALEYYFKSLDIAKRIKNSKGVSVAINNIGNIYMHQKKYDLALKNYFYCLDTEEKKKDTVGMSDSYNNIGLIYLAQKKYNEAEKCFEKSLTYRKQTHNLFGICNSLGNIAVLEKNQDHNDKAKVYFLQALKIANDLGLKKTIQYCYENLAGIAKRQKNLQDELKYFQLSVKYKDIINNEDNIIKQTQDEMQYAFEKQVEQDQLKVHKEKLTIEKNNHKQKVILWAVIFIAIITLIFSWFLYKRWQVQKDQNKVIEQQKSLVEEKNKLVEEKNKEILDSITYAKRIQTAILPPERLVKEYLINSFVLYKPKDIVAGDFYWIEPLGDTIIFAVADCTGHGVPGAMISVVCHNALNRSVREFGLQDPGKILDKTREIIISEFDKNDEEVSDGMDISLCTLDLKNQILQWAGANSPLWVKKKETPEIIEIIPNKQPIGKHITYESFETQQVKIEVGDSIYLFTDGYADQFGGFETKKFKAKQMRDLILSICHEPMHIQRTLFDKAFEDWKGDLDQIDDVCVIGIQL